MPVSPLEVLADELAIVAGRIERESALRLEAALSDLRRVDAERELRLVALERRVEDRLAAVKDGSAGPAGASVTVDDVRPLITAEIERAVASIPPAPAPDVVTVDDLRPVVAAVVADVVMALPPAAPGKDGPAGRDGKDGVAGRDGKDADPAEVARMVTEAVAALPPAPAGLPGVDGKDGRDGRDVDPDHVRQLVVDAVAALPPAAAGKDGPAGRDGKDGIDGRDGKDADPAEVARMVTEAVAALPPAPAGPPGPAGKDGAPGMLPVAKEWSDRVHYAGEAVVRDGSTFQARRDTGRQPPHDDWICLAAAGRDGQDGRSVDVEGTYDPEKKYVALRIVAVDGSGFISRCDNPGPCPGPDWQLIASKGKRGQQGERGAQGERGTKGDPGLPLVAADIDDDGLLTLTNGDGSTIACDLYPLLAKVQQ